jgi:hypothetical protein
MKRFRDTEYFVTEDGRVFRNNNERKFDISNKGYKKVDLSINGKRKHQTIHRMVAELYVPNPNNYPCVNHKDGNKFNNNYSNLEWITLKQNSQHSVKVLHKEVGENHSRARIPNKIVSYIKRCRENSVEPNYERIANTYRVGIRHIKNIYRGYKRKFL